MVVAHNAPFDLGFLSAEFSRCGWVFEPRATFCTMRMSTSACRLLRPSGGYKWPTLEEAVRCLGIQPEDVSTLADATFGGDEGGGFHDARYDTSAVYLIYRKLMG